jgi:hypothetical protein
MYTREGFERQRTAGRRLEHRDGRLLAVVSVGLGVGQLIFIRWLETRLEHRRAVAIEGGVFLAYIALVGGLLWRLRRRLRGALLTRPQCGVRLKGLSERVAAATGRCDFRGGQVVEGSR